MAASAEIGSFVTSVEELATHYGDCAPASLVKVSDHVTAHYRAMIEASPFMALATSGPEGLDCSPRGDVKGFVRVHDARTLLIPDRRGNNRTDSLQNIVRDPRVGLLFLIPGLGQTLRVNGLGRVSVDPALLESFAVDRKAPRSVIVLAVQEVYFQCARAIVRSELWNPERHVSPTDLPTPGDILAAMTHDEVGGPAYDAQWPARARSSLW
jgi:uncharacterized protein